MEDGLSPDGERDVIGLIHQNIPRGVFTRLEEKRLFAARLGMFTEIAGFYHGEELDCPFCGTEGTLGRSGRTSAHFLRDCTKTEFIRDGADCISLLWKNPERAVKVINDIHDLYSIFFSNVPLKRLTNEEKINGLNLYHQSIFFMNNEKNANEYNILRIELQKNAKQNRKEENTIIYGNNCSSTRKTNFVNRESSRTTTDMRLSGFTISDLESDRSDELRL
jgi:hypothetical protein